MFSIIGVFFAKILVVLLSVVGFFLAKRIYLHKNLKKPLACPMRSNCEVVVHSDYSKFFGIRLEVLGMMYYFFIAVCYAFLYFFPNYAFADIKFFLAIVSTFAFALSVYLVSLQAFVIKEWCAWCLGSAIISTLIMVFSWISADLSFFLMLYKWKIVLVILHAFVAAVGVGATTVTDVLFFKFLKDYRISSEEVSIMNTLSRVLWIAIFMLILTGVGFVYLDYPGIFENTKFVAKIFVVGIIFVNGLVLNFVISPKLMNISFGEPHHYLPGELHHMRKLSFASGAISIVSWYTAFLLGSIRSMPFSTIEILSAYMVVVVFAVAGSQIFEKKFSRKEI